MVGELLQVAQMGKYAKLCLYSCFVLVRSAQMNPVPDLAEFHV